MLHNLTIQNQPKASKENALHIEHSFISSSLRGVTTQADGTLIIISVAISEDIVVVFAEIILVGSFAASRIHEVYLIVSYQCCRCLLLLRIIGKSRHRCRCTWSAVSFFGLQLLCPSNSPVRYQWIHIGETTVPLTVYILTTQSRHQRPPLR